MKSEYIKGRSPRMRGRRGYLTDASKGKRSIPAYAGEAG